MFRALLCYLPCLVVLTTACDSMRPEGAWASDDAPANGEPTGDVAPDSNEDIYEDGGDATDDEDEPPQRGGPAVDSPLVGDYWMRGDVQVKLAASQLGISIKTTTDTRVYSLVTVRQKDDGRLEMRDWQCTVRVLQSCQSGCTRMNTTLRDLSASSKAFMAPRRTLTVVGGHWTAAPVAYAIGYKGDYSATPALTMPSSATDPLVYDPDGGGKGIDFSTSVTASGFTTACNLRVVQKVAVRYEGDLDEGGLKTGSLIDVGSDQGELSNSCSGAATEPTPGDAPNSVRLIRSPLEIDTSKVPWACPTLEEFEALLGD
ncbi:MAG: hypothetical protein ABW352_11100 [Polyangiales bacterium]